MSKWFMKLVYGVRYCPHCSSTEVKHWHEIGEKDYTGYIWCGACGTKYWSGFNDRVFG